MATARPSITVDTSIFTEAVTKAHRVAPNKGAAFDKAAGLMLEVRPSLGVLIVRSTNMEITYRQEVPIASFHEFEDDADWRVPSALISGIMGGYPTGTETKIVPMDDGRLELRCGKARSKINAFAPADFPRFKAFSADDLTNVERFAHRVAQVSWACDPHTAPWSGVHINGESLIGCDRYRLAVVPCVVPVEEPITVPLDILAPILRQHEDARMSVGERRLLLMTDDATQMTSVIYDAAYAPVERLMATEYNMNCAIRKDQLVNEIQRMLVLVKGERYPVMSITIGNEVLKIFMDVPDVGEMEGEVEAKGATHDDFEIYYTPRNFVDGLQHADDEDEWVKYEYHTENPLRITKFSTGAYQCWIVPRQKPSATDVSGTA